MMGPHTKERLEPMGRYKEQLFPASLRKEHGPAGALMLDFWPPELGGSGFLFVVTGGTLVVFNAWQALEGWWKAVHVLGAVYMLTVGTHVSFVVLTHPSPAPVPVPPTPPPTHCLGVWGGEEVLSKE